jgi:hypothetical protein
VIEEIYLTEKINSGIKSFVKITIVSDGSEAAVVVPPVVKPVQVQLALRAVPVEVRHVAEAVAILPHGAPCTRYHLRHCPSKNPLGTVSCLGSIILQYLGPSIVIFRETS